MKIQYDKTYYDNLKKQHSGTAKIINEIRWNFVKEIPFEFVLDYGCGCGELSIYIPSDRKIVVDSYDIGFLNGEQYPQTGISRSNYDLIFFNDVIEHVDWGNRPDKNIINSFKITKYICVSIPVWKGIGDIKLWKHYKPGEHLTYFNEQEVIKFFKEKNMMLIKSGYPECPPRQDIFSAIFKNE